MSVRLLREYLGYRPTYLSGTFVIDDHPQTGKAKRTTHGKHNGKSANMSNGNDTKKTGGYDEYETFDDPSFESLDAISAISDDDIVDGGDDSAGTYNSDDSSEDSSSYTDDNSAVYSGAMDHLPSKIGGFIERINGAFDDDVFTGAYDGTNEVVVYGGALHTRKKYKTRESRTNDSRARVSPINKTDGSHKTASTVPCNAVRLFATKHGSSDDFTSQEIPAANDPSVMQLLVDIAKEGAYELDPPEDLSPDRIKGTIWDIIGGSDDFDGNPRDDSAAQDDENAAGLSIMDMIAD